VSKFGKSLIAVVVTLGAILWSASSWAQSLKVGSHEPWVVQDMGSNGPSGLFADLVNAIAKDANLKVDYQVMKFADLIPAGTTGKIDIIATMMAITPERKQQVDFSIPIYNPPTEAVVVPATDMTPYKALTDFQGLPVGAQKGSIHLALLQRTGGFSEIKTYDTVDDAWAAVASGTVKAAVTAGPDTIYAAKHGRLPNVRIVTSYQSQSSKPSVGIGVRKGNAELLGKIDNSLAKLEGDGTVKAIFAKHGLDDWAQPK
jgi:polar amino acid transport system substrate-binding protein